MKSSRISLRICLFIAVGFFIAIGVAVVFFWRTGAETKPREVEQAKQDQGQQIEIRGGVRRGKGQKNFSGELGSGSTKGASEKSAPFSNIGNSKPIAKDANPSVSEISEIVANRKDAPDKYLAAVSAIGKPEAFDAKKYRSNPKYRQRYLKSVQPGRVFQPAQPGKGVGQVKAISPLAQTIVQGESVRLRVRGKPASPYTFTSFDLGRFVGNSLTSITVEANEKGVAVVDFVATPGTVDNVRILVAGPSTSGQVKFNVNVKTDE